MIPSMKIEAFKFTLAEMVRQGCRIRIADQNITGRIVGIGFKPFWTGPADSKIARLDFNYLDDRGRLHTYRFHDIIGYDVISNEDTNKKDSETTLFDLYVFSPSKANTAEPYDKIRLELTLIK
ncbi:MAG: hypothetical protein ACOX6S_01720 [Clostridia bacterium]|jgi:hypothetical protein